MEFEKRRRIHRSLCFFFTSSEHFVVVAVVGEKNPDSTSHFVVVAVVAVVALLFWGKRLENDISLMRFDSTASLPRRFH